MTSFSLNQAFCSCIVVSPALLRLFWVDFLLWSHTNNVVWIYLNLTVHLCFHAWVPMCVCLLPNPPVISPLYLLQLRRKMDHLPLLIRLSHNRAPVSQSTGHQATQPIPINGVRPTNNLVQDVHLPYPSLFLISSSGTVILATISPSTRPVTWRTDKIWGPGSCHSSVDVWTTVLPRKVHTHDWGCMGLILLHSPLCLWSVCARKKGGCWLKRKQGHREGRRYWPQMFLAVSLCHMNILTSLTLLLRLLSQNNHLLWVNKIWE